MDQILIKDLLVRTVIGISAAERSHLSDVLLNLVLFANTTKAGHTDDLQDCINYSEVATIVQSYAQRAETKTVEALAEGIAQKCLGVDGVIGVKVRVEKPNVVRFTKLVGVEIERFSRDRIPLSSLPALRSFDSQTPPADDLAIRPVWKIRRAVIEDIPILVKLRVALFESMGFTDPVELINFGENSTRYFCQLMQKGEYTAWVAESGETIISTGGFVIHQNLPTITNPTGQDAHILSMYTIQAWRRQGIGRSILSTIIDYCRNQNISLLSLKATDNGRGLYTSLGFRPIDTAMGTKIDL
jgi:FolB domain-containing protein